MGLVRKPAVRPPFNGNATARQIGEALRNLFTGRLDLVGEVTLTANAASTTVTDIRMNSNSGLSFCPLTANAAAEIGNGTMYVTEANHDDGSFVITHANNAQTDRTFRYTIMT